MADGWTEQKTILLVEDEAIIALTEKLILENNQYRVIIASSGEKAILTLEKNTGIDLVLMDINLGPGMDGTEAAERILRVHDLPLVFLSSHTEREVVEKTEGITSYGYIVKNSGEMVLIASIKMAFRLFDSNRQLRDVGNRLRANFNAIPDLMFIVDRDGFYRDFVNNSGCPLAMAPEKIIGAHLSDVFPPEEVKTHLRLYQECIRTGEVQTHIYELDMEDEKKFFDLRIAKLDETSILAIIRDITEKQKSDLQLRKISQAVRQSSSTVVITDADARIEYVNPKFTSLTGYLQDEVTGQNPCILQSGLTPEAVYRELWDTVTSGKEWRGVFWNRKKNGDLYCESASIAPVKDNDHQIISYIAVKEDITDRVKAEEALEASTSRFQVLAECSPILIWEADENKLCTYFNSRWLSFTGRTMEEELGTGWTEGVHPEDIDFCLRTFHSAFDRRQPFAMEYRLRKADGTYGLLYDQGSPKIDPEGNFSGYIGACTDITQQKQKDDNVD
jgi:PAS domain S-box-containing protein